jgi:elongation factor G
MHALDTARIRNVALLGHSGAGKTTLAEAILHRAGVIPRQGAIDNGNTALDHEPEEVQRRSSVSLAVASFDWSASDGNTYMVNLLDTPGHPDFEAEVDAALSVADLAVLVVSATDGVEVGTLLAWRKCADRGLPCALFVTKEDKTRADFDRVLADIREAFGAACTPIELPLGEEASLRGVVDVLTEQAHEYGVGGAHRVDAVPTEVADRERAVHDAVIEEIVSGDDEALERYLDGVVPSFAELERTLAAEVLARSEFPVMLGSGITGVGVDRLVDYLCEIGPAPTDRPVDIVAGDRTVAITPDPDGDPLLYVFKTFSDQYVGQVSVFKVVTGTVRPETTLRAMAAGSNGSGSDERLHALFRLRGSEQLPVTQLSAGQIGGVAKLVETRTGTTLAPPAAPARVTPPPLPIGNLALALVPKTQSDDDKLSEALQRLLAEDPSLGIRFDELDRRTVLHGLGDAHLSVALARLERKYGVRVDTEPVRVPYCRTITTSVEVEGRLKKQSGGHGQFAVVNMRVSPLDRGKGFEFVDAVVGGAIPKQYVAAVKSGVEEAMTSGGGGGMPIVDIRVECLDGKTHSVDSSDMAFKTAGATGLAEAIAQARPIVLEPISAVELIVPASLQGDVMGDLSARRGRIVGNGPAAGGDQSITAEVPTAELVRYPMELRAITGGRGTYVASHAGYAQLPDHLVPSVLSAYAR